MIVSFFVEGHGLLGEDEITMSVTLMVPSTILLSQMEHATKFYFIPEFPRLRTPHQNILSITSRCRSNTKRLVPGTTASDRF
jgi:hypothetical protein